MFCGVFVCRRVVASYIVVRVMFEIFGVVFDVDVCYLVCVFVIVDYLDVFGMWFFVLFVVYVCE